MRIAAASIVSRNIQRFAIAPWVFPDYHDSAQQENHTRPSRKAMLHPPPIANPIKLPPARRIKSRCARIPPIRCTLALSTRFFDLMTTAHPARFVQRFPASLRPVGCKDSPASKFPFLSYGNDRRCTGDLALLRPCPRKVRPLSAARIIKTIFTGRPDRPKVLPPRVLPSSAVAVQCMLRIHRACCSALLSSTSLERPPSSARPLCLNPRLPLALLLAVFPSAGGRPSMNAPPATRNPDLPQQFPRP